MRTIAGDYYLLLPIITLPSGTTEGYKHMEYVGPPII